MDNLHLSPLQKNIVFFIVIALTFLVFYSVFNITENIGKYSVSIVVTPEDASVKINGVESQNVVKVYPGVYTIEVSKDGFLKDTQTIDVKADVVVGSLLIANSAEAKKWVKNNLGVYPEDFDHKTTQQLILNQLPYSNIIYSMSVEKDSINKIPIVINVDSFIGYYNSPIDKIRQFGYDPEDYRYVFNYENPFQ